MAQKVTAMESCAAVFAGQIDNVAEFCRDSRSVGRRFTSGGTGSGRRSRRAAGTITAAAYSPGQTPAAVEEAVLRQRKQLLEAGRDHGPQSIVWALQRDEMPCRRARRSGGF